MSVCPHCQKTLQSADFCEECFLDLRHSPTPPDKWLERSAGPAEFTPRGPDLAVVQFVPRSWSRRVLLPRLGQALALACLLGGGLYYQQTSRAQAQSQALAQWKRATQAAKEGKLDEAVAWNHAALSLAVRSGNAPLQGQIHQSLGRLAETRKDRMEALREYHLALELLEQGSQAQVQQSVVRLQKTLAQQQLDKARVEIAQRQYVAALKSISLALNWLEESKSSPAQRAHCHYLTASVYQRVGLPDESRESLQAALRIFPKDRNSLQLLARLPAPKRKLASYRDAVVTPTLGQWNRRYQQQVPSYQPPPPHSHSASYQPPPPISSPGYPTYQPPAPVNSIPEPPVYRAPAPSVSSYQPPAYAQPSYPVSSPRR